MDIWDVFTLYIFLLLIAVVLKMCCVFELPPIFKILMPRPHVSLN